MRAFDPSDVPRLVELWTRAYAGYAGLVVQTPDSWRWRVLERPGVAAADVLVAVDDAGTVVGYGVIDAKGTVLEIAVDPAAAVRDAAAAQLVAALEARCRAHGVEAIRFVLPDADDTVQRALRRTGYWSEPSPSFSGTIVDVAALLEALLPHRVGALPPGWAPTVRLDVERGADWPYPRLTTRVEFGPPLVVTAESPGASVPPVDCTISLDLGTLNRLFVGLDTFEAALAGGKVSVRPETRTSDAATFLGLVTLGAPWYSPSADDR